MLCFDDNCHSTRVDFVIDGVGDLRGQPFLHLEPSGKHINMPRYFAEPDNLAIRNVSHVTFAEEREQMVFTQAENLDIPYDDHFNVSYIKQSLVQERIR